MQNRMRKKVKRNETKTKTWMREEERGGERSPKRARIEDEMDEIDAVLEMAGMKEGVRTCIVKSKKHDEDETRKIAITGKQG